ncbi:MAG: hypothetical protein LBN36_01135, partial [Clostridiales Family XIII bacterium]|nr:hypothetical protein [Clostridiales Family XIII bacterium]
MKGLLYKDQGTRRARFMRTGLVLLLALVTVTGTMGWMPQNAWAEETNTSVTDDELKPLGVEADKTVIVTGTDIINTVLGDVTLNGNPYSLTQEQSAALDLTASDGTLIATIQGWFGEPVDVEVLHREPSFITFTYDDPEYTEELLYSYVEGKMIVETLLIATITRHSVFEGSVGFVITMNEPIYESATLVASGVSGVTVSGSFTAGSTLAATVPAVAGTGCDALTIADNDGKLIALYDLTLTGGYQGDLTVSFPVDPAYNGKDVVIIHHTAEGDEQVTATVTDGKVSGTFSSLSPFGVVVLEAPEGDFKVGDDYFDTLTAAVAAVPGGGTITMTRDVTIGEDIMLLANKAYTIDFGGHILTGNGEAKGEGTLIPLAGTITIKNGTMIADFTNGIALQIYGGTITLDDLTITATKGDNARAIEVYGGTVTILSGNYVGAEEALLCDGISAHVTFNGGHFICTVDFANDGSLYLRQGQFILPAGFKADKTPWHGSISTKGPTDVTISLASSGPTPPPVIYIYKPGQSYNVGINLQNDASWSNWLSYDAATRTLTVTSDVTISGDGTVQTQPLNIVNASNGTITWTADWTANLPNGAGPALNFTSATGDVLLDGAAIKVSGGSGSTAVYSEGNLVMSGGLVLVNGTDFTSAIVHAGNFQPLGGIIAAFDDTQAGPFVEGTHTALTSTPADALTWTEQGGHGGVTYGSGQFLDMGVTVVPAAATTEDDVWVNGERFTSDNLTIVCGEGTAVYDPATETLTLTDATIDTGCAIPADLANTYCDSGIFTLTDLHIVLVGDNSIADTGGTGIDSYATDPDTWDTFVSSISISGSGNLTIYETAPFDGYGIYATGALEIDGVALNIASAATGIWTGSSLQITDSQIFINNAPSNYYYGI